MSLSRQQRRAAERQALKDLRKREKSQNSAAPAIGDESDSIPAVSEARLNANRINAQASTGPTSEIGKATSSRNSFKHGLYSKQLVVPGEDPAQLDALKAALIAEHQPATTTEELLVNEMAEHYWRLLRFRRFETSAMQEETIIIPQILAVQRFMSSAERGFHKALKSLRDLRKERQKTAQDRDAVGGDRAVSPGPAASGGFVPAKSEPTEPRHQVSAGFVPPKPVESDSQPATGHSPDEKCKAFEAVLQAA